LSFGVDILQQQIVEVAEIPARAMAVQLVVDVDVAPVLLLDVLGH